MKNYPAYIMTVAILTGMAWGFSACKDDDPPAKPKLSFAQPAMTVNEDGGPIQVELVLDKPHGKDVTVEYTLSGTASDQAAVGTANADYEVIGDHGVVVIQSGETSGAIDLDIYPDAIFEQNETIQISVLDVNTADIEITADDKTLVTINNDDAALTASFTATSMTVNESDGADKLIDVTVQLDKAAPVDVTVTYELKIDLNDQARNDAIDSTFAFNNEIPIQYYDYYIKGTTGQVVVPAGYSSANIQIQLFTDFLYEDDETIEINITPSAGIQVGTNKTMKVTLQQQDGKVIALVWEQAYSDVDMDMFLWYGSDTTTSALRGPYNLPIAYSITPSTTVRQELLFIPALITTAQNAGFGLSCTYYSGTANPMNFEVHYADYAAGVLEPEASRDIYSATYTLANINAWDQSNVDPVIVQKFSAVDGALTGFTQIKVPPTNSRMKTYKMPSGLRRTPNFSSQGSYY